jgi:predicted Zn-dependent protease
MITNQSAGPVRLRSRRVSYGQLLVDVQQPAQALTEFEAALRTDPNRFNGVYGTAPAAELAGDRAKARTYYGHLVALCTQADTARPELMAAKAFLAKQ